MEPKQFEKIEQWFVRLNEEVKGIRGSMATRDLVENRFNMLATSMQKLFERLTRLEERLGKDNADIVTLRLALKRLEDEIEELRQRH